MDVNAYRPYSEELRGDLLTYLRERQSNHADNHFYGHEHFSEIWERNLVIAGLTFVRIMSSPIPDSGYIVNENGMLISRGARTEDMNMSLIPGKEGVHDPKNILENRDWSIHHLRIY